MGHLRHAMRLPSKNPHLPYCRVWVVGLPNKSPLFVGRRPDGMNAPECLIILLEEEMMLMPAIEGIKLDPAI